jgi:precorrin-2 dehydrogenase/sirohydrochlorin ferrochelatase
LESKRVILIGGGVVAARKAQALLEAGGTITAISPEFSPDFESLAASFAEIHLLRRAYQSGDLEGAFLVIAATDAPQVNQAVWEEAIQRGCLVNVVDDPQRSNFIVPAVVQRGEVKIAVTTGGASPALARRLRERLEVLVGQEYGELAALLSTLRPELIRRFPPGEPRLQAALELVDSDLLEVIRQQGVEAAQRRALELLEAWQEAGG